MTHVFITLPENNKNRWYNRKGIKLVSSYPIKYDNLDKVLAIRFRVKYNINTNFRNGQRSV